MLRALRNAGRASYAEGMRRYFRKDESLRFFGVKTPELRRLEREAWPAVKGHWRLSEALAYADLMVRRPELEAKVAGFTTLYRFRRQFDVTVLRAAERWLAEDHCASWAAVDALANRVTGPALEGVPEAMARVRRWGRRRSLWLRRAALVTLIGCARRGTCLDAAYADVLARASDPEDLMHKAMGWLLREAGTTDRERLAVFLERHGRALPRVTVRYAIERFPERRRRALLQRTRGA